MTRLRNFRGESTRVISSSLIKTVLDEKRKARPIYAALTVPTDSSTGSEI